MLETEGELLLGDHRGTMLPVVNTTTSLQSHESHNITFRFVGGLPRWDEKKEREYDGVSVLVNDVERYRGFEKGETVEWSWERHVLDDMEGRVPVEYFRFAYVEGSVVGDYTKAGKWDAEGRWVEMGEGASR